jgi:hypothetical protein
MPGGPRYNFTLNQTEGVVVLNLLDAGSPLVSSNPNCPIVGFQIFKDDGNGNIVGGSQPPEFKLETEKTNLKTKLIIDNGIAS